MPPLHEPMLNVLHRALQAFPLGVTEYNLLLHLRKQGVTCFEEQELSDNLTLFRVHFLLFHFLYALRDRLREQEEGDLEIHCLMIRLGPFVPDETSLPSRPDSLREYYMDTNHLEEVTRDDVDQMMHWFWDKFENDSKRSEALAILDLDPEAMPQHVKKRYRELIKIHHPDHGGDPEFFMQIQGAAEILFE